MNAACVCIGEVHMSDCGPVISLAHYYFFSMNCWYFDMIVGMIGECRIDVDIYCSKDVLRHSRSCVFSCNSVTDIIASGICVTGKCYEAYQASGGKKESRHSIDVEHHWHWHRRIHHYRRHDAIHVWHYQNALKSHSKFNDLSPYHHDSAGIVTKIVESIYD